MRIKSSAFRLSIHAACGKAFVPYLRWHLRAAHHLLSPPLKELSVALIGDVQMSRLHQRYLGVSGPTDVLTFELEHDRRRRVTAGEVVVCVPQAARQAQGQTGDEVLLCALHGLLHLCGYDDRTKIAFAAMHRAEDRILSRLGVGNVFHPRGKHS